MRKRQRLRSRSDFQRLRREGLVKRHPDLLISYLANSLPHNRYGFIIAKRLGNAVTRNRVRRLLRESVRQEDRHLKQGYDVVFIARSPIVGKPFHHVQRIVSDLFRRSGLSEKEPDR